MKKILVVGATGHLGPYIVKALIEKGHQVSVLLRAKSIADRFKTKPLTDQGVELIEGSFENHNSLRNACQEKDVVISCVGPEQIPNQIHLARAAADAGVERFVPSEFGIDPYIAGKGSCDLFDAKAAVQEMIKELDIGFTPIYTNGFMEFWATGLGQLGHLSPPECVQVYGDGHTSANMTAMQDVGKYTASIVNDPETIDKEVLISTTNTSQAALISLWEDLSNNSVEKEIVSPEELDNVIKSSITPESIPTKIVAQLHRSVWIRGEANRERDGVLQGVTRYPEIQPIGLRAHLMNFI